ncbi:MAG: DotA/TraY family protein [Pseudomonadota bacterium]
MQHPCVRDCNQSRSVHCAIVFSILLLTLPNAAFAFDFFKSNPLDYSIEMLATVFGNTLLGSLFAIFNTGLSSVGVIVLSYTTFMGSMQTAHHGELLGRQWSMLWIPMRSMLGVGLLAPTASGYSLIQMFFMWVILQGVGLANMLWTLTLDNYQAGYSMNQSAPGAGPLAYQSFANDLAKAVTCAYTVNELTSPQDKTNLLYLSSPQDKVIAYANPTPPITNNTVAQPLTINIGLPAYPEGSKQVILCGQLGLTTNAVTGKNVPAATMGYALSMMPDIQQAIITTFNDAYHSYGEQLATSNLTTPASTIATNVATIYSQRVNGLQNDVQGFAINSGVVANGTAAVQGMEQQGWIIAGSFYFTLTSSKTSPKLFITTPPNIPNTDFLDSSIHQQVTKAYNNYLIAAQMNAPAGFHAASMAHTSINTMFSATFAQLGSGIISLLTNAFEETDNGQKNDPMVTLTRYGQSLTEMVELLFFSYIALLAAVGLITNIMYGENAISPTVQALVSFLSAVFTAALTLTHASGIILGFYLPMIPYILFIGSAVTWLVLCIEALVAGPILALSLSAPGKNEFDHLTHAGSLLTNLALWPVLTLLGFILSSRLIIAIYEFVVPTLVPMIKSVAGIGAFSAIGLLLTITYINLQIVQECWALIHVLPERTIRWIGGHPEESIAGELLSKGQEGTEKGAQYGQSLAIGTSGTGGMFGFFKNFAQKK